MSTRYLACTTLVMGALAAGVASAPARAEVEHFSVSATGALVDCRPVGGELIGLNGGSFDVMRHRTVDEAGGIHFTRVIRSSDITGVGLASGQTYRLLGAALLQFNDTDQTFERTSVHHGILLGPDGHGFVLFLTLHMTDNGNETVSIRIDKTECLG